MHCLILVQLRPFVLRGWQTAVCQLDFNKGLLLLYALLALTRVYGELDYFYHASAY